MSFATDEDAAVFPVDILSVHAVNFHVPKSFGTHKAQYAGVTAAKKIIFFVIERSADFIELVRGKEKDSFLRLCIGDVDVPAWVFFYA